MSSKPGTKSQRGCHYNYCGTSDINGLSQENQVYDHPTENLG